jgi:hypothetical protein
MYIPLQEQLPVKDNLYQLILQDDNDFIDDCKQQERFFGKEDTQLYCTAAAINIFLVNLNFD